MRNPPNIRLLVALLAATALALGAVAPAATAAAPKHKQSAKHGKSLSKRMKLKIRRQLAHKLKLNPAAAFEPSFVGQASLVDFRLPLTVRLNAPDGTGGSLPSDDQLEIDWDDSTTAWPIADGTLPAPQTPYLDGIFTMEATYGGDTTGYGEPGALETLNGMGIDMQADPFTISEFSAFCASGPQLATDPANKVEISASGPPRYGLMNIFTHDFRGSLSMQMTFKSQRTDLCGGSTGLTDPVDNTTAPPMPVRFTGQFFVSPSIGSDGTLRFGKITVDDSVTPQPTTFAYVRACTGTVTCDPMEFPARLKIKKLTAEVLLGDIRSG